MNDHPPDQWDELFGQLPIDSQVEPRHQAELRERVLRAFDETGRDPALVPVERKTYQLQRIGRLLMKYQVPYWAAAALLLTAFAWLGPWGTVPALAVEQVIQNLADAKTARFQMVVQVAGQPEAKARAFFKLPNRLRQEMDYGLVFISDWEVGKMVTLTPAAKQASVISLLNQPAASKQGSQNPFESTRDLLRRAIADPQTKVESLGTKTIDGRQLLGFRIPMALQTTTVWADPDTRFPVQIEADLAGPPATHVVMSGYEFNVELDEALFSLTIPDGFTVAESQLDVSPGTEMEFLATLKTCAETLDGELPSGLNPVGIANYVAKYFATSIARHGKGPAAPQAQAVNRVTRGLLFVTTLNQGEWGYAGEAAKLGEKDKPILWYKPAGSSTYRVIYADLTARESTSPPAVTKTEPTKP